jgi:SMI1-KNR4 cell-wall
MTLPENWKTEIARIVHWKQIAAEHDTQHALPWSLPKAGAQPDHIREAENKLGVIFSPDFKEFLALANGWNGFYVLIDLFGTQDFLSGRAGKVRDRTEVAEFVAQCGLSTMDVVPIGASDAELDVFLLVSQASTVLPGTVLWWANEEIDRYPTFREFLGAMVNYNAQIANKLVRRK